MTGETTNDLGAEEPLWETHSGWWQEEFTDGADPEYEEQILPIVERHLQGAQRVLDVGCGEGQLSRRAAGLGAQVVGLDPTWNQITVARERAGGPEYARARAEQLPCRDAAFDAVVMCLVVEHLDPFEPAIHEMARVLEPGGICLLLMNHPLLQCPDSGWVDDHIMGEQYWRVGPYLPDDSNIEEVSPGVNLPFMHRPLSRYVHVMGAVGLPIEDMDEPPPPPGFLAAASEYGDASSIPRLMVLRARRVR